jgi:hypothetical protein
MPWEELQRRSIVFELQALGEDQKRAFCLYLLQTQLLLRKHQQEERERLQMVLVFDEGHNVFPKDEWGKIGVPSKLAREIREYGVGLIIGTQQPDISDSVIANSGIKIIFRTDYHVDFASKLMGVDQRWLSKIPLGQGIARLPSRYYQPFLFAFPPQPLKNTLVTDNAVKARYDAWTTTPAPEEPLVGLALREKELALLLDVAAHPISTVTQRYHRLRWNPNTGNPVKDSIIRHGLATFSTVDIGRTHMKFLTLTEHGEAIVIEHGGTIRHHGTAGIEHEFWRARLRERCENRGYTVTDEYRLPNGKRVDLQARRSDKAFLLEVETGKSDVQDNINRAAGHGTLIVFFTNNRARDDAKAFLPPDVLAITPDTLNTLHDALR